MHARHPLSIGFSGLDGLAVVPRQAHAPADFTEAANAAPGQRVSVGFFGRLLVSLALLVGCTVAPLPGQSQPSSREAAPAAKPAAAKPAEIVVLGASLSAGFACPWNEEDQPVNRAVRLRKALGAVWTGSEVRIRDLSDGSTFLDPVGKQGPRVDRAVKVDPAIVIAVDFMFWFGYGYPRGADEVESRLALQREGLAILERLGTDCPIVVGDYANMEGADPRMLHPQQVPSAKALARLNEELNAWAAQRSNVILFPLAKWAADMKKQGRDVQVDGERLTLDPDLIMQTDGLHPRPIGVAIVAEQIAVMLREHLSEDHALAPPTDLEFVDFVDAVRADLALETAQERAREKQRPAQAAEKKQPQEAGKR